MYKRAQGISINVIIIAAIALIVLVVLVFILTGRLQIFGEGLDDCESKGGRCMGAAYDIETRQPKCPKEGYIPIPGAKCGTTQICCMKIFGE